MIRGLCPTFREISCRFDQQLLQPIILLTDKQTDGDENVTSLAEVQKHWCVAWLAFAFKQAVREAATICPAACKLTFDLLTLKLVSESAITVICANFSLPRPLCSRLRPDPMYATDRQTDVRRASSLNASALWGRGIIISVNVLPHGGISQTPDRPCIEHIASLLLLSRSVASRLFIQRPLCVRLS